MSLHDTPLIKIGKKNTPSPHRVSQKFRPPEDLGPILDYFEKAHGDIPCFLTYTTAYTLLVAVVLSAQATDRSVNLIMPRLIAEADDPEKMLNLGLEPLRSIISSIGLYQRKSTYVMGLSTCLIEKHASKVPSTFEELLALPGVGRKTANVILNEIFGWPTIPVDTHVERVSKRLGWVDALANPHGVEQTLDAMIPLPWKKNIHAWLIMHGRTLCTARSPKCTLCPIRFHCDFFQTDFSNKKLEQEDPKL